MDIFSSIWRHRVSKEWSLLQIATAGHLTRFYPFSSNSKCFTSYITIIVIGIIIVIIIIISVVVVATIIIIINITITVTATCSLEYRVFLNLLLVVQLVKRFHVFCMESQASVSCPQEPATGPYPESDESHPHPRIPSDFPCLISYILVSYHVCMLLGPSIS